MGWYYWMTVNGSLEFVPPFIYPAMCEWSLVEWTFIQYTVYVEYTFIQPLLLLEQRAGIWASLQIRSLGINTTVTKWQYNTTVTEWIQFTRGTKRPSTASPWPRCVWSDGGVKEGSVWPIYKNIHYTVGSSLAKCPCSCKAERLRSNGSFLSPLCFFSFLYIARDGCCQNQRGQVYWTLDRGSRVVRHRFHSIS